MKDKDKPAVVGRPIIDKASDEAFKEIYGYYPQEWEGWKEVLFEIYCKGNTESDDVAH